MKRGKILNRVLFGFSTILVIIVLLGTLSVYVAELSNTPHHEWVEIYIAILTVIAVVIALRTELKTIRSIKEPLIYLAKLTKAIEEGDVSIEVNETTKDEFAILFEGYASMINNTRENAKLAEEIAKGNLTVTPKIRSDKDLLGLSLKHLVEGNNEVLSGIKESSLQLTAGAGQVASASQALAQGSTEQASAIEEITASMEDIAKKTNDNASLANNVDILVQKMVEDATKGNNQMKNVVAAMEDISSSSHSISKVIKTIDDIAFQTNILALNATVEAARAGVHGKGFAVVAEEVKNLAEKSSSAAQETAELIQNSIGKVESGSKDVSDMGMALASLQESMQDIVESVASIALASNDQATAVAQINQAIDQVSQVVQTNSATSEQCAAASEQLSNQAQNLRDMIGRYRLKEQKRSAEYSRTYASEMNMEDNYGLSDTTSSMSGAEPAGLDYESIISLDGNTGKF